jgi:hypothetical protein
MRYKKIAFKVINNQSLPNSRKKQNNRIIKIASEGRPKSKKRNDIRPYQAEIQTMD